MTGTKVQHSVLGPGVVTELDNNYVTVKFANRTCKFVYPDVFERFMVAEDVALQQKITDIINETKVVEEQKCQADEEAVIKYECSYGTMWSQDREWDINNMPLINGSDSEDGDADEFDEQCAEPDGVDDTDDSDMIAELDCALKILAEAKDDDAKTQTVPVRDVPTPSKPKFSRGMLVYTVIAAIIILWVISLPFQTPEYYYVADHNGNGIADEYDREHQREIDIRNNIREKGLACFLEFPLALSSPVLFYLIYYLTQLYYYNLAQTDYPRYAAKRKAIQAKHQGQPVKLQSELEEEFMAAVESQSRTEPWAVKYSTSPCPYCGHYKVRNAKWEDKQLSVAFWGVASDKIGKHYKCDYCKKMW